MPRSRHDITAQVSALPTYPAEGGQASTQPQMWTHPGQADGVRLRVGHHFFHFHRPVAQAMAKPMTARTSTTAMTAGEA